MTDQLTGLNIPADTRQALRLLLTARGASIDAIHPVVAEQARAAGIATVWIVTADTFEIGASDLDNQTVTVGAYGSLPVAVADVWRRIVMGEREFNPCFAEHVIQTVAHPRFVPAPAEQNPSAASTAAVTLDGCDYDGDESR
jgi:hypothetical protein